MRLLAAKQWFSEAQIRAIVTTVHGAQGSERDFVLLDVTNAPLQPGDYNEVSGQMWEGIGWQSKGSRLLTTALTRARVQVLVIMFRNMVGLPVAVDTCALRALPRLNVMLHLHGRPADIRP
jgi:hypothetical protein